MAMMLLRLRPCLISLLLFAVVESAVSYEEAERPFGGKSAAHERHLQECNVVLANWTLEELSTNLDAGIDAALGEGSAQANIAKATLLQSLQYGVQIRRLCAGCSDFPPDTQPAAFADFCTGYGSDVDFSGLLMIPLEADGSIVNGTHPGGIWCHGTSTQSVPSIEFRGADSGIDLFINAAVASTGSITMMPDYMGYGESSGKVFKAYLVKQQYHTSIIPLWLMADRVVQQVSGCTAALADAVAVLGYSEGGYAAVAVAEGLYNMGVEIIKVEAGAGPYRMGTAVLLEGQRFIDEGIYPLEVREYLALIGSAYSSTYPELVNFEEGQDMLSSDARDTLVELVTNSSSKALVNAQIPTDDPLSIFSPQLVTFTQLAILAGDTDPCNNPDRVIAGINDLLCEALQDNDLTEILETTPYPVRLCHSPDDDVVSYANLPNFDANVLLEKLDSTGSHVEAATTCLLQSVLFMLSDDFLDFEVADKTMDMDCAVITMTGFLSSNSPSFTNTFVPTITPAPTVSPSPTVPPTKEDTCGKILASWDAVEARNIVNKVYYDMFGEDSNEYALFELFADQSLQYGVQIRKLCASCSDVTAASAGYDDYCGQGMYGSGAIHSGLLMLPMSSDGTVLAEGTFPGVVYNHEPTVDRAPSVAWSAEGDSMTSGTMFGVLPAAAGSIAIMPDFFGYGESNDDIFKAFLVKKAYRTSIVPLWLKTAAILQQETKCTALADAVMISGFCEGGYASVAVADALSELGVDIIRVHAGAVPGRVGSIYLPELVKSIDNATFPSNERFMLALFGSAYSATYPGLNNFEEGPYLLNASVRDEIVQLVSEAANRSSVEEAVPVDDPLSILNEDIVTWARSAYLGNDTDLCGTGDFSTEGFQLFCDTLAENDLMDVLGAAAYPVTLCHGREDTVVSPANLPDVSANANLLISLVDGDHAASYVKCTSQIITFLSLTYMNYPIVPKHDESVCTNVMSPSSTPASTPSPATSFESDMSAASVRTLPVLLISILCCICFVINLQ